MGVDIKIVIYRCFKRGKIGGVIALSESGEKRVESLKIGFVLIGKR